MMMRRWIGFIASVLLVCVLVACAEDDEPPAWVLQPEDLPSDVSSFEIRRTVTSLHGCVSIANAENFMRAVEPSSEDADRSSTTVAYLLDNADRIDTSTWTARDDVRPPDEYLESLRTTIEDCADGNDEDRRIELVDTDDPAMVHYRVSSPVGTEAEAITLLGERVWQLTDDHLLIGVGIINDDGEEPAVSALDLLPTALDRAEQAPTD